MYGIQLCTLLLLLVMVAGCGSDAGTAALQRYNDRLARTLQLDPLPAPEVPVINRLPRPSQLRTTLKRQSVSALEFLDLDACALQVNVGRRNSILGRVAPDSQRLLLELEFLRLAPACIDELRAEKAVELAASLETAVRIKQQQLDGLVFNATLAGVEFRKFWAPVDSGSGYPGNSAGPELIAALEKLGVLVGQWQIGNFVPAGEEFEALLATIASGDGGRLWRALAIQGAWLEQADQLIAQRMAKGPICAENIRFEAADVLPNVVHKYFITGIQPRAADLGRRYYQLIPPLQRLEGLLADVLPDSYIHWQEERDMSLKHLQERPRAHVEQLKSLLEGCGSLLTR